MSFNKHFIKKIISTSLGLVMLFLSSCEEENIADIGDLPDRTPPEADFSSIIQGNGLTYQFNNASTSATDYEWIIPEGAKLQDGFKNTSNSIVDILEQVIFSKGLLKQRLMEMQLS